MSVVKITTNLEALNADIRRYQLWTGKTSEEVLVRQGGELGFRLGQRLRALAPDKGEIRAAALRRLERGHGIQVRESIRERVYSRRRVRTDIASRQLLFGSGKGAASIIRKKRRLNLQALAVEAEINIRERGRGFLAISSVRPRATHDFRRPQRSFSRYGPLLSEAGLRAIPSAATLQFRWGGFGELSEDAVQGLRTAPAQNAVAGALADTANNIRTYLDRELVKGIRAVFRT